MKKLTKCALLTSALVATQPSNLNAQDNNMLHTTTANAHIMATGNARGFDLYGLAGSALSSNTDFLPHFTYMETGTSKAVANNISLNARLGAEFYHAWNSHNVYGGLSVGKKLGRFTLNAGLIGRTMTQTGDHIAPWARADLNIINRPNTSLNAQFGGFLDVNNGLLARLQYTRRINENWTFNAFGALNDPFNFGGQLDSSFFRFGASVTRDIPQTRAQRRKAERAQRKSRINTSITGGTMQHSMVIPN